MKTSLLFFKITIFLLIGNTLEAQKTYDSEMKLLAQDVSTLVKQNNKLNVAVWYFKDSFRKKTKLGRYIAQEFSVYFANVKNGFDVMDRDEVEQVLEEHRMKEKGFIDPRTAKEMGMFIHADAVITGTIDVSFRSLKIRVKLINTQTGRIIKAVMRNVPKDENIKYILHETGINNVKNIDKDRTRLKRGERYGNPQYVDQECEKRNIGDYCFENDTNKYYKINLKTKDNSMEKELVELLPLIKDKKHTKILLVTLAEATPTHEAKDLQEDLKRAGIEPYAWVVNRTFALTNSFNNLLCQKALNEIKYITIKNKEDELNTILLYFEKIIVKAVLIMYLFRKT